MLRCVFVVECGIARFLCVMRVFEFRHHPHPETTFVPNFISFAASIAELVHGEKSRIQSVSHSASLFEAARTEAFASEKSYLK